MLNDFCNIKFFIVMTITGIVFLFFNVLPSFSNSNNLILYKNLINNLNQINQNILDEYNVNEKKISEYTENYSSLYYPEILANHNFQLDTNKIIKKLIIHYSMMLISDLYSFGINKTNICIFDKNKNNKIVKNILDIPDKEKTLIFSSFLDVKKDELIFYDSVKNEIKKINIEKFYPLEENRKKNIDTKDKEELLCNNINDINNVKKNLNNSLLYIKKYENIFFAIVYVELTENENQDCLYEKITTINSLINEYLIKLSFLNY
jgi:hypothetical protein